MTTTAIPTLVPRPPLSLAPVFDDVSRFEQSVIEHAPMPALQGPVMSSVVELCAITGEWITAEMEAEARAGGTRSIPVNASYRMYWARSGVASSPDLDWVLHHPRFVDAADRLFGGVAAVVPDEVYVNAQPPQAVRVGSAHVDIPKFRGIGRREVPVWLLTCMRRSRLFDRWRVPVATAVCWFYDGPGGTYTYWPDGPLDAPRRTVHPFANTAVVGENDTMFHRGDHVGPPGATRPDGLTLDAVFGPTHDDPSTWTIRSHRGVDAAELGRWPRSQVRVALSWSAEVFVDDEAHRLALDHSDDLDVATVVRMLADDLRARGALDHAPDDPLHDVGFVAAVGRTYRVMPRLFPDEAETAEVAARERAISSPC
jgi:hypothetical protein